MSKMCYNRQQWTGLNLAMNDTDMLPGSYPHRKYMICMVWNIILWRWEEVLAMREERPNTEDRATQPMEAGGWVSQFWPSIIFKIAEMTVLWRRKLGPIYRGGFKGAHFFAKKIIKAGHCIYRSFQFFLLSDCKCRSPTSTKRQRKPVKCQFQSRNSHFFLICQLNAVTNKILLCS